MNSLSPGQIFSARTAPLWVVLAFIIGMTIYSLVVKIEAGSDKSTRDLAKTFPRARYEAAYEQRSPIGLSILYVYSDGQGKVRHEATMPHNWAKLLAGYERPVNDPIGWLRWEADWQSALKYIRADAMIRAREKGAA